MQRGIGLYLVAPLMMLGLLGCRFVDFEERDPWRAEAENACLEGRMIQSSSFVQEDSEIRGKGTCGMTRPLRVAGVSQGFVAIQPKATLACPIVSNVEAWMEEAVQPAAFAWFGEPIVQVKQISAYSCRTMNGQRGASISEHAFGNALDISTFRLESGREVNFKQGWKGKPDEQGFLRNIHAAACERFTTVLAPGADMFHYDHIHVDLMRRPGRTVCKPAPQTVRPPNHLRPPSGPYRPQFEGVPTARAPSPAPAAQKDYVWQTGPRVVEANMDARRAASAAPVSTSPWAQPGSPDARVNTAAASAVVARDRRPVGAPMVIGNHSTRPPDTIGYQPPGTPVASAAPAAPPGAPLPIAERVRQSLGLQDGAPMRAVPSSAPAPAPSQQNPYGLVPPGRIPSARTGSDPTVTGTVKKETSKPAADDTKRRADEAAANAKRARSLFPQLQSSEPASVFNLPTPEQASGWVAE